MGGKVKCFSKSGYILKIVARVKSYETREADGVVGIEGKLTKENLLEGIKRYNCDTQPFSMPVFGDLYYVELSTERIR